MAKFQAEGESKNIYHLKEDDDGASDKYRDMIKSSDKLIIVDFYAEWCGPCKMIGPKFLEMATEFPNCIFVKVNVDEFEEIAEENNISCMPTFNFFRKGEKIKTFSGADAKKLKELITELASN
ncbi:thioredoxin-2-like [Amphiura filiformis]|uniref:thioredoxin-2-like n=1 Tax=Amphiura filiformis TaxID=82378 RepID=UPI003B226642